MLPVFQLPDGRLIADQRVPMPSAKSVKWRREYPINADQTAFRVAPIFNDIRAALQWLDDVIENRRKESAILPRVTIADLGVVLGKETDFEKQSIGIGPTHQYSGYLEYKGNRMSPLLFRGDSSDRYALIPTLSRCLWPGFIDNRISQQEAVNAVKQEGGITHSFVQAFFKDGAIVKEFPWVMDMNPAYRAAIARHHGFSSWILDFTVEPAIAAFFATGCGERAPARGQQGAIWIIDEGYLESLLGEEPFLTKHPGYEARQWQWVDVKKIRANGSAGFEEFGINRVGCPDFWALQESELNEGFCLSHHYAPGIEVERMWNQKWCGVEASPPIGKTPFWLRALAKLFGMKQGKGNPKWEYILNSQMLFQRMCSRIYFQHDGACFEMPERDVTAGKLLPKNDPFLIRLEDFKRRHNLRPGTFIP